MNTETIKNSVQSINQIIAELPALEQKIIASLAVAGVATTGQIWRLAGLTTKYLENRNFPRTLVSLCESERLIGVVIGTRLPREMDGKIAPESWYLTVAGVDYALAICPRLARYARPGLPCGEKLNRLGHELLVTESLLYFMRNKTVLEYKPERVLKSEIVSNRLRNAGRSLSKEEAARIVDDVRGEETGDFKVRVLTERLPNGDIETEEIEGEAAVRYRGKVIGKKPANMRWFTGSQAQADMVEANQKRLNYPPVVLGNVSSPFFLPEVAPYLGRRQHLDNYLLNDAQNNEDDRSILQDLSRLAADETLPTPHRRKLFDFIDRLNQQDISRLSSFGFSEDSQKALRMILSGGAIEIYDNPLKSSSARRRMATLSGDEISDNEGDQSAPEEWENNTDDIDCDDINSSEKDIEAASENNNFANDDDDFIFLYFGDDEDENSMSDNISNQNFSNDTHSQKTSSGVPEKLYSNVTVAPKTRIRVARKDQTSRKNSQVIRRQRPNLERKVYRELGLLGAATRNALAKILHQSPTNVSNVLRDLIELERVSFLDIKPNPGAQKGRPSRLFYHSDFCPPSLSERIKLLLISRMIEEFHGTEGVYRIPEKRLYRLQKVEFCFSFALDEVQTAVLIADPNAAADDIIEQYKTEQMLSKNSRLMLKIACASSQIASEISLQMPLSEVYDAEKRVWLGGE